MKEFYKFYKFWKNQDIFLNRNHIQNRMLSILIPVFNHNIIDLVNDLMEQGKGLNISFEIIALDDASDARFVDQNRVVGQWENVAFITRNSNIGRAAARNQLVRLARYPYLLFIDSDASVIHDQYLNHYLNYLNKGVVICGGTTYQLAPPEKKELLFRWKYGKTRESLSAKRRNKKPNAGFSGFNFMINKDLFLSIQFDENLKQYGHEDTLFGYELAKRGVKVLHIENPLLHLGLEPDHLFIEKTAAGLKNLYHLTMLYKENREFISQVRLLRVFYRLKRTGLLPLPVSVTRKLLRWTKRRLISYRPNLLFFDLYKLLYYSSLYCS